MNSSQLLVVHRPADVAAVMGIAFSEEQLAAITAPLTPNLIVAGAGTGKTTVMAARVVWLVGTGQVRPDAVLGLTFTRRAAGELSQRITAALASLGCGIDDDGPFVATYDAFVGQLLAGHGLRLGAQAIGRLLTSAEPYQIAVDAVIDPGFEPLALSQLTVSTIAQRLMRLDQQMASHLVSEEQVVAAAERFQAACLRAPKNKGVPYVEINKAAVVAQQRVELVGLVRRYRELKAAQGCVEFADQQAAASRLVLQAPQVGVALREQFPVVLLDEYQDTSAAQAAMLAGLFSGPDDSRGRGHPVSAVGDPMQAIYGWRGAAADNMGQFGRLFPQADGSSAPSYPLRINRRSGAGIVALANAVATRLPAQAMPLEACADKAPGLIEARSFVTWSDEVAAVAARVVEAHRLGQAQLWSDAAVLVRRNADVPALYKAMTSLGVPVEIVGLGGLLALPEVASVVALLHLALDPADNPSAALLVSGPVCGLGPADMEALARRARQLLGSSSSTTLLKPEPRLVDAIFDPGTELSLDAIERLRRLANHIRAIRRQRHESAVDLVQMAADELGLTAELAVPSTWAQATAAQMRRFVAQVADHAARVGPVSLDGLLAWLHAEAVFGDQLDQATQSDDDSVKLLTVHKAKGLEWSVVLLPSLAMNIFPNDRVGDSPVKNADALPFELRLDAASLPKMRDVTNKSLTQFADALKADQIASEDRLSYVAVSRAKSVLVASTSAWRAGWATPRQPSRLFDAIVAEATASTGLVILEPDFGETNPLDAQVTVVPWPTVLPPDDQARLDQLAAAVMADEAESEPIVLSAEDAKRVAAWRAEAVELAERASARPMTMPTSLSASALLQARRDPAAFFASVARPMPRLADDAAMRGTLFHRWVEQRFSLASTLDEVDEVFDDDIAELVQAFEAGPYAQRSPLAVEAPFVAVIAGQQVRGRIDAVYKDGDGRYQIVDWKTSAGLTADPVQLAVYRLAWAQVAGCRPGDVDAVFYYVGQNKVVRPRLVAPDEIETWVKALRSSTWLEQKEVS